MARGHKPQMTVRIDTPAQTKGRFIVVWLKRKREAFLFHLCHYSSNSKFDPKLLVWMSSSEEVNGVYVIWWDICGLCFESCWVSDPRIKPRARHAALKRVGSSRKLPDKEGLGSDVKDSPGNRSKKTCGAAALKISNNWTFNWKRTFTCLSEMEAVVLFPAVP